MEDSQVEEKIKLNVKDYLNSMGIIGKAKELQIDVLRKISGMTNVNYHVRVTYEDTSKENKKEELNLFFRKFGIMSGCLNRELEQLILEELSNKQLGPPLLFKEKDYCILEFIVGGNEISLEERYLESNLKDIIKINSLYALISNIYQFKIKENSLEVKKYLDVKGGKDIQYTLWDEVKRMLPTAKESFENFKKNCLTYFKSEDKIPNEIKEKIKIFQNTLDNYENIFLKLFFGLEGFFVLTHNDMHRWNFVKKEQKIYAIDHEYACLGLIGMDVANYMNENSFYFGDEGYIGFKEEEVDVPFYFGIYQKYLEEIKNNFKGFGENIQKYLEKISTLDYYLNLHRLTNTFWFLFCAINLEFKDGKAGDTLAYGCDRLKYAEKMRKEMKEEVLKELP
ncbi:MAG: hypothetical protein MJ252_24955 [archaeon]|nr:hypothetical protein [archaeon]